MQLGRITTAECINTAPPSDTRCSDPAFALQFPEICPIAPQLIIKPSFVLTCQLGSVQFAASYIVNGMETDVTSQTIFQTSDANVAVIGAASGNATGLSSGMVTISGAYQGNTAFADLTVLGDNCCADETVAMMVVIDNSRSMSQSFGSSYPTKLAFAKAAAQRFISEVNESKDLIGLMTFNASGQTVLSAPVSDKTAVAAMVPSVPQTQQLTTFFNGLTEAIAQLNSVTADLKVIILISDGEDTDTSYNDSENPIALLSDFKMGGGIVMPLGVRAHDFGYNLLSAFSTGGFFINGHNATADASLDYISGLKGYICAGNCVPTGDNFSAAGSLNYCEFSNWNVLDGHVDLLGNGFLDLLPGNGLYVDLAGSTAGYKGVLTSKATLGIIAGNNYRLKLNLAGNQRVNASPNSVRAKVFTRNTDGIPNQDLSSTPVLSGGAGSADVETYEYAFSYLTASGETELTPPVSISNGGFSTFNIAVTSDATVGALSPAVLIRFWKRELGTDRWYLIGEGDPTTATFNDTLNNARLAAAIADGTLDQCVKPADVNTTGTPIVFLDQTITINSFQQDFQLYNLSFNATQDADVWISIQQTDTPAGYDSIGLLLASVAFENATDGTSLFEDDFDTENITYVPPACGVGGNYVDLGAGIYGYAVGYSCYGEGCLTEPPAVQTQDPSPLTDIEGGFTPPTEYTATKTVCKDCPTGFINLGPDLIPVMTSNTAPSGVASASGESFGYGAFHAFDDGNTPWTADTDDLPAFVQYKFTAAKTVLAYSVKSYKASASPKAFELQGSNNGSTWDTLDSREDIIWSVFQEKKWLVTTPGSYLYYRLSITELNPVLPTQVDTPNLTEIQLFAVPGQACATESYTSEVSQSDANNQATILATDAANALLNCTAKYDATDSNTAYCPLGQFGNATRSASYTSLISQQDATDGAHTLAVAAAEAARDCTQSNNTQAVKIGHGIGSALPYPSVLHLAGYDALDAISKVRLVLKKVASNVNLLRYVSGVLMSPAGTMVNFFRAVEHNGAVPIELVGPGVFPLSSKRVNSITFDDDAAGIFPDATVLNENLDYSFQPTVVGASYNLPAPLPAGPYTNTTMAAFNGESPNGSWSLWFSVITEGYYGAEISQGWDLEIDL